MRSWIALIALLSTSVFAQSDPAAKLYDESCSGCHTIGGGDGAGPDLIASTKWPDADLRVAIVRMKDNVGPLTDEQVDSLVAYLKKGQQPAPVIEKPKGSPETGKQLFFGRQKLANGGSPCFACHAIGGEGGNLAADLTGIHKRRSEATLLAATSKPGFPMMKAAYAGRAVTDEEARHLLAFFEAAAAKPARRDTVAVAAVSFAGVLLGAVAFVFRSRKAGVRSRLVSQNKR